MEDNVIPELRQEINNQNEEKSGQSDDSSETGSKFTNYVEKERERVKKRVDGFEWRDSEVWITLTAKFGPRLNHEELTSIAELIAGHADLKIDRDAKRRKVVLLKWFEEHWSIVRSLLPVIVLEDE